MKHKNQLHIVADVTVTSGGEGLAALRYAESIARAGGVVTLLAKHIPASPNTGLLGAGRFELQDGVARRNLLPLFFQYDFIRKLSEAKNIDLIHLHGMWSPLLAVAAMVARKRGIPLVVSPHGCLEPWALGYKYYKKWLALKTYQGAILRSASLFVATARQELESIRRLGLRQPIAVIPNGVDVEQPFLRDAHEEVKTILFLSRVHPIKGLLDLVEAWALVRRPGWRIVIAGGDEGGYRAKVEALIRARELESDFEFVGFVTGVQKQACFDSADIFVLPTYSENFGLAIAEALANELPVITTTGAPWQELLEQRCGWWVTPGVAGVAGALRAAIECDPVELGLMGKRGRQLVLDKYSWTRIGSTALEVSEWLLNRSRPMPDAVNVSGP